jgi:hypothetical protein
MEINYFDEPEPLATFAFTMRSLLLIPKQNIGRSNKRTSSSKMSAAERRIQSARNTSNPQIPDAERIRNQYRNNARK